MATNDQGLNRGLVEATRAGTRAFISMKRSKLKAKELCITAAAKPESQYTQVKKDVLA